MTGKPSDPNRVRVMPSFRFGKVDIVFYGSVLLAAAFVALFVFAPWRAMGATGEQLYAILTVDGKEVWRADLEADVEQEYQLSLVGGSLTVRVGNGQARVTASDCPDQVCVHTGIITLPGQTVVCLPNRAVLSIRSEQSGENAGSSAQTSISGSSNDDIDIVVR